MNKLKKAWHWIDDKSGFTEIIGPLMRHPIPRGTGWAYVFGSATLFCFVLQIVTGVALSLLYQPSSDEAYDSLQFITNEAVLGNVLRGIHYYGASGMILLVGIHMMRVYITASYKFPRQMSWISGIVLLVLVIGMGFTGQLLRWDSNGVWSSVVAAEQLGRVPFIGTYLARLLLGGETLGGHSLSRFYAFHVFLIPAIMFIVIGYHLMLVIRNGISEPPRAGRLVDPKTYRTWYEAMLKKEGVPFWPYVAWRDAVFGAIVIVAIVSLAVIVGPPPLTAPPDPSFVHTSPKPDWYLTAIFALFALMPPDIESYIIFLGPLVVFAGLFALPFISSKGERHPIRRPWAVFGCLCVVIFTVSLVIAGEKAPWSANFDTIPIPPESLALTDSTQIKGADLFYSKGCQYCHTIDQYGGLTGPDLSDIGNTWTKEQLQIRIVNGSKGMPAYGGMLTNKELEQLIAFLSNRKK